MKIRTITPAAVALVLLLAGCGSSGSNAGGNGTQAMKEVDKQTSPSLISASIHEGIEQAKRELATKDIDIGRMHVGRGQHGDNDALPRAAITPQGDLVIAGRTIDATPEQHTLLLDYRQQVVGIAEAGMDIGEHGANLGTRAAREAIWGALAGKSDKELEASIKPQAEQIKVAAMRLCQDLPGLLASQQKLAAAMPQFRPYATLTQKDVDDCGRDEN
ncbi:hypothetical protein [Frateuria soli]|uniref:hypothetical protein n=1 Tax=Frateuria soli TaxID=1542730 RepID=UPI001E629B6B|nr:hypothetical protein [Frateuria soli]UGB39291.1 hypothetical protein LQ771_05445 [Frateuria soli]